MQRLAVVFGGGRRVRRGRLRAAGGRGAVCAFGKGTKRGQVWRG